jgi:hypothetical protein
MGHRGRSLRASSHALLRPFGIRPRTIWPLNRVSGDTSFRGYMRGWFEETWAAYLDAEADTTTQPSNVRYLVRRKTDT